MPAKTVTRTVSPDRRLPVDPDHGLHVPDAAALAANGVQTAGHRWLESGEPVPASAAHAALQAAGIVHGN